MTLTIHDHSTIPYFLNIRIKFVLTCLLEYVAVILFLLN
jgi:hypothetical protein